MLLQVSKPERAQFGLMSQFKNIIYKQGGEIHYIGGTDILPAPLPACEEAKLIAMIGSEDEDNARRTLVERNLRLVVYIAKKFDNTGVRI